VLFSKDNKSIDRSPLKEGLILKQLISGQKLRVENHTPGCPNRGLDGVHIHKTILEGKDAGKFVCIDVRSGIYKFDPRFTEGGKAHVDNEIRRVLKKDRQKLKELSEYLADILNHWGKGEIGLSEAREYAGNIAERFGLKPEIKKEFIEQVGENIQRYISIHWDDNVKYFSIDQSQIRVEISDRDVVMVKRLKGNNGVY